MEFEYILCYYAEIGVKGKNRRYFEDRLKQNIKEALEKCHPELAEGSDESLVEEGSYEYVKAIRNRIVIKLTKKGMEMPENIVRSLKNVFGIAYFAFARESKQNLDNLKEDALRLLSQENFESFRITARRSDKTIPLTTKMMNETVGEAIVKALGKEVNLTHPGLTCHIDLFHKYAFIYTLKTQGSGGLPVGASGKVVILLSGGIDSPVASYYAMKRGANGIFVHFHSVPYSDRSSIEKVREIIGVLGKFQKKRKLYLIPFGHIQKEIVVKTDPKLRVVLYRRFMMRIAEAIAWKESAHALVTGESLGQVASQTLENIEVIEQVTSMPVLRPLIGLDKQEIVTLAREIETYPVSIEPDQDCCSLFVPKHPATKSRLEDILEMEKVLDVENLVMSAVEESQTEVRG